MHKASSPTDSSTSSRSTSLYPTLPPPGFEFSYGNRFTPPTEPLVVDSNENIHTSLMKALKIDEFLGQERPDDQKRDYFQNDSVEETGDVTKNNNGIITEDSEFNGFMKKSEISFMCKIQISQLTSANPELDDYYYNKHREESHMAESGSKHLLLPLLWKTRVTRDNKKTLEKVLGTLQSPSIRTPRALIKTEPTVVKSTETNLASSKQLKKLDILHKIEALYENYITSKDCSLQITTDVILSEILKIPKGKSLLGLILRETSEKNSVEFFLRIIRVLNPVYHFKSDSDCVDFINSVLTQFVTVMSHMSLDFCTKVIDVFLENKRQNEEEALLFNRIALVILCLVLSQGSKEEEAVQTDQSSITKWKSKVNELFTTIKNKASSYFLMEANYSSKLIEIEYYSWQFFALLDKYLQNEEKSVLVLELRDVILSIVKSKKVERIEHLNIYLSSLGLDASQLV